MATRKGTDWLQLGSGDTYVDRVRKPLQCLIFILPFLLVYQIGSAIRWEAFRAVGSSGVSYRVDVVAFVLLQKFFLLFGAAGNYLPLLAVVIILLSMHIAHKDKWQFDPPLYFGMLVESLAWAVPVLVIGIAVFRHMSPPGMAPVVPMQATAPQQLDIWTECILSVGAGVYEELLFRLIGITLLTILFSDVFELKLPTTITLVIITSAILFAAYHYLGEEGRRPFDFGVFFFRVMAGVYFAGLYIFRGFGIVVGAHAFYDLMAVWMNHR